MSRSVANEVQDCKSPRVNESGYSRIPWWCVDGYLFTSSFLMLECVYLVTHRRKMYT